MALCDLVTSLPTFCNIEEDADHIPPEIQYSQFSDDNWDKISTALLKCTNGLQSESNSNDNCKNETSNINDNNKNETSNINANTFTTTQTEKIEQAECKKE